MRSSLSRESVSDVLGTYPTGVVVLTALGPEGQFAAILTDTFASVSTVPPMVTFAVPKTASDFAHLQDSGVFCANVLAIDQEHLCRRFGGEVTANGLEGVEWRPSPAGAPILSGVVSWMDCQITSVADGGNSYVVVATITALEAERDVLPLLHFQRGYGTFSPGALVTSQHADYANIANLAEAARDSIELLARDLGAECSVLVRVENDSVFVATANHSASGRPTRLGLRSPILPPLGGLLVDSPGAPTTEEWLARLGPDADSAVIALAVEQLQRVRQRGWSVSLRGRFTIAELDEVVAGYTSPDRTPEQEQRLLDVLREMSQMHEVPDLRAGVKYDVLQLAVPVHDAAGDVVAVLRLGDLPTKADRDEVMFWLSQLQSAAQAVEARLDGR